MKMKLVIILSAALTLLFACKPTSDSEESLKEKSESVASEISSIYGMSMPESSMDENAKNAEVASQNRDADLLNELAETSAEADALIQSEIGEKFMRIQNLQEKVKLQELEVSSLHEKRIAMKKAYPYLDRAFPNAYVEELTEEEKLERSQNEIAYIALDRETIAAEQLHAALAEAMNKNLDEISKMQTPPSKQ